MTTRNNGSDSPPSDLIGLSEAASLLPSVRPGRKVHVSTLARWVMSGRLRGWRRGRFLLVSRADILSMAEPVAVELQPETRAAVERRERDRETDEVLRRAKIRR